MIDKDNNWILTGSFDGGFRVWSMEGRYADFFKVLCCSEQWLNAALSL